jgi:hypothetical protein
MAGAMHPLPVRFDFAEHFKQVILPPAIVMNIRLFLLQYVVSLPDLDSFISSITS